jgi:anti-sigma-K factor RskA
MHDSLGKVPISALLLERYHAGEITAEEKRLVESALAGDSETAASLAALDRSDEEFRARYPAADMVQRIEARAAARGPETDRPGTNRPRRVSRPLALGLCAAALVLAIALPALRFLGAGETLFGAGDVIPTDRAKGPGDTTDLRVYLKNDTAELELRDQAVLHAGDTIQLVYLVNAASPADRLGLTGRGTAAAQAAQAAQAAASRERYGVIFSIDGRSAVTLHYPYRQGQSTHLVTGRLIPLAEAYTLDDAPDFEVFFFIIGDAPLDTQAVLRDAEGLARNPGTALARSGDVFWNHEVKTLSVRKE